MYSCKKLSPEKENQVIQEEIATEKPTNDPFRWIPEGVYYDMFDVRNENVPVLDAVSNYTNQQFFNAIDIDIRSMPQYRNRLLQENGNNQLNQVIQLFLNYGY